MTDKDTIRAEIERRMKASAKIEEEYKGIDKDLSAKAQLKAAEYQSMLVFIDSLQEESVSEDFEMALAEMIDKAQKCVVEPWVVAAQWKDELVKLAKECKAMQEHPKDCMYSKDNYTDEDRKILCEGCEEDCKYNKKEEPASDGMEKELDRYIRDNFTIDTGQLDRFDIEPKDYMYSMDKGDMLAMARHFANWQKQQTVNKACKWLDENIEK